MVWKVALFFAVSIGGGLLWAFFPQLGEQDTVQVVDAPPVETVSTGAPVDTPDSLAIRASLLSGDYEALDTRLTAYQAAYDAGTLPAWMSGLAYEAFRTSDRQLGPHLDAWVARMPQSFAALTARGTYLAHLGWLNRGDRLIGDTSAHRLRAMNRIFAAAKLDLELALSTKPTLFPAYDTLLDINMAWGRLETNATLYAQAFDRFPRRVDAVMPYLWTLSPEWGGSKSAVSNLVMSLVGKISEEDFHIVEGVMHLLIGRRLTWTGDRQAAMSIFDQAVAANPEGVTARYYRAENRLAMRDPPGAEEDLGVLLEAAPNDTRGLVLMARTQFALENPERALHFLDRVLQLDPLEPEALTARGVVYSDQRKFEKADADLSNALIFGPRGADELLRLSMVHFRQEKLLEAIEVVQEAVRLDPGRQDLWSHYESVAQSVALTCGDAEILESFLMECRLLGPCTVDDERRWTPRIERSRANGCGS